VTCSDLVTLWSVITACHRYVAAYLRDIFAVCGDLFSAR